MKLAVFIIFYLTTCLASADLKDIYINRDKVSEDMKCLEKWISLNAKTSFDDNGLKAYGSVRGYYGALKIAKEILDDPKIDESSKILICGICCNYAVQICRCIPDKDKSGERTKGEFPNALTLASNFNAGFISL